MSYRVTGTVVVCRYMSGCFQQDRSGCKRTEESYDCEERRLGVSPPPLSQVVDLVDLGLLADHPFDNGALVGGR